MPAVPRWLKTTGTRIPKTCVLSGMRVVPVLLVFLIAVASAKLSDTNCDSSFDDSSNKIYAPERLRGFELEPACLKKLEHRLRASSHLLKAFNHTSRSIPGALKALEDSDSPTRTRTPGRTRPTQTRRTQTPRARTRMPSNKAPPNTAVPHPKSKATYPNTFE
mmetsp:Transcript_18730/g.30782  ORF Transcript_18730/g.30782 Transcript_18730/m.30782 type:complete len:163 (-) Transcript_18730:1605-2093(-)